MLSRFKRIVGFLFFWRNQMNMHKGQFLLEDMRTREEKNNTGWMTGNQWVDGLAIVRRTTNNDIEHAINFVAGAFSRLEVAQLVADAMKVNNVCWDDLPITTLRQKIVFTALSHKGHTIENQRRMISYLYANGETQV